MGIFLGILFGLTAQASVPNLRAEADQSYLKRGDEHEARSALTIYRTLYAQNPSDAETAWRLSMASYFVGLRYTHGDDELKKIYAQGRDAGLHGAELDPNCAPCHFWGSINMALYGQTVGPFKMLFTLGIVEDHLRKSIALDPGYAYSGAYRLLGLIRQKLPGVIGGSNRKAREYFLQAIATTPDEPLNYLFLAKLFDETHDRARAIEAAEKGAALPRPAPNRLESYEAQDELKELAAKWSASN